MKLISILVLIVVFPQSVFSMHIAEGFLPAGWCLFWTVLSFPFVAWGVHKLQKRFQHDSKSNLLLGVAGGFTFLVSSFKIPSFTGSCSHMVGTGLGAVLFGPAVMSVVSLIVLVFQALFLAHGGFSTLGANVFSMGIAGPYVSWALFKMLRNVPVKPSLSVLIAVIMGGLTTYSITAFQMAVAFVDEAGFVSSFLKFITIFGVTQLPLSIVEGIVSMLMFNFITSNDAEMQLNTNNFNQ